MTHPSTDPTHHAKRHPDPFSRFATVHFPDRLTDTQTERLDRRQVSKISAYARYIDRERRANNNIISSSQLTPGPNKVIIDCSLSLTSSLVSSPMQAYVMSTW